MIRQPAFGNPTRMLKGGLHCHTTRSDGKGEPAEVIRLHKANGFDFLAITDHNLYNYQNYAPDVDMTILPGMEVDRSLPVDGIQTYHFVCLGPEKTMGNGYDQDERAPREPITCQADVQPVLDALHAKKNLTIHCHPEWSGIPSRGFDQLTGNFAMEIWNSGCALEHEIDTNALYWDEMLMQGKRILGVATDDGHRMNQHCNGWVHVNAENNVSAILQALTDGAFYSSCGPEIYDFYVEDGVAVLECSPCAYAGFRYGGLPPRLTHAEGTPIVRAEYKVPPYFTYIRGIVKDEKGRRAWTNPIFLK